MVNDQSVETPDQSAEDLERQAVIARTQEDLYTLQESVEMMA